MYKKFFKRMTKIINDIELDVRLTRETEQLIHYVHSLDNLPGFQQNILGETSLFLSKLSHSPNIDLRCPKSHRGRANQSGAFPLLPKVRGLVLRI